MPPDVCFPAVEQEMAESRAIVYHSGRNEGLLEQNSCSPLMSRAASYLLPPETVLLGLLKWPSLYIFIIVLFAVSLWAPAILD